MVTTTTVDVISMNLDAIRERVERSARLSGRRGSDITVLVVTKTFDVAAVEAALGAGLTVFGENRIQEAEAKIPLVNVSGPAAEWHFLGHLQTNKVRPAVRLFQTIQSVDSVKLAGTIDRIAKESGRRVPVLIEVNTSGEESKHGFALDSVEEEVGAVCELDHLAVKGLMTVGPLTSNADRARDAFVSLRQLRDRLSSHYSRSDWATLSMGMSDDFELAVEEGATMIRLGRAIFGPRP